MGLCMSYSYALNETLKTIEQRHSVRSFTSQPVSEHDITRILESANQAPSAHNQQAWRFIVIKDKKKLGLAELVQTKATEFPKPSAVLLRMASRSIATAPVVIAVANTGELIKRGTELFKIKIETSTDFFRTMEIQGSAAAVQNMLLAATSLGLATVWLGSLFLIKDDVLRFLGERVGEFMAVVPVGYATKQSKGPKKKPLEKMVRYLG